MNGSSEGAWDHAEAEELPELPAPISENLDNEPTQTPVDLGQLNCDLAKRRLVAPIRLAVSALPVISERDAVNLVGATIDRVALRAAAGTEEAISINELAEKAGIGHGRVGERFGVLLPSFANLVARGVYAQARKQVYYEELSGHAALVGRRHNGVGTDKLPALANSLHLLAYNLGASNRHCPAISEVLTMGTRWDRTSQRFGTPLPSWASNLPDDLPGPFAEHLAAVLQADRVARVRLAEAVGSGRARLENGITAKRLKAAFSRFLVIPPIPYGPPETEYRSQAGVFLPGRDAATVEVALASGRSAALACGAPAPSERLDFEEASESLVVGKLPSMYELDIHKIHGVEYRWSPKRHELGRYEAGAGSSVQIWRFVRCETKASFWRMVSLVERQAQVAWTERCTRRWERDCRPGLQRAHLPESCAGVRALLAMANAGIVDALRGEPVPPGPGR